MNRHFSQCDLGQWNIFIWIPKLVLLNHINRNQASYSLTWSLGQINLWEVIPLPVPPFWCKSFEGRGPVKSCLALRCLLLFSVHIGSGVPKGRVPNKGVVCHRIRDYFSDAEKSNFSLLARTGKICLGHFCLSLVYQCH